MGETKIEKTPIVRTPTQRHAVICASQRSLIIAASAYIGSYGSVHGDREVYRKTLLDAALEYARIIRLHVRER